MKKLILSIILCTTVFALSPQVKYDMLKTKLANQLKAKKYSKALDTMAKIKNLGVKNPKSFDYFEGKALFESGQKAESYSKFEKYVESNGKKGKYYKNAISYLIEAEEAKELAIQRKKEAKELAIQREREAKKLAIQREKEAKKLALQREEEARERKYLEQFSIKDKYGNIYKVVKSPYTSKIWLDRNLGASRVCQSLDDKQCYGDYFQWGRDADGHEKQSSPTTSKISSSSTPSHSKFIKSNKESKWDWLGSKNDNLWQGIYGKNNPCPKGFRIPTINELLEEILNQGVENRHDAFNNFLRLPSAGYRSDRSGSMNYQGSEGHAWSSSVSDKYSHYLYFFRDSADKDDNDRADGFSVRCLKD